MKISKKQVKDIIETSDDMFILGSATEDIQSYISNRLISLGCSSIDADKRAERIVKGTISAIKEDRRLFQHDTPCSIDLDNEYEIIVYIRDLLNLSPLLDREDEETPEDKFNSELLILLRRLRNHGWGETQIHNFINKGGTYSNFEFAKGEDGNRAVPCQIKERGDRQEYLRNRFRLSK